MDHPQKLYTGPAVPVAYDPVWQTYTNLTQAQIAAFQSFPQDLLKYAKVKRWKKEISSLSVNGMTVDMSAVSQAKIANLKQAVDANVLTPPVSYSAMDGIHQLAGSDVTALYSAIVTRVQATYTALATLADAIDAVPPTITTRDQVDAVFIAIT